MSTPLCTGFFHDYGKSHVRLARIERRGSHDEFIELSVSITLEGDFDAAYRSGDNSKLIATDTMKNIVYVLAKKHGVASIETFAQLLARHFLHTYSQVHSAAIECRETPWARMASGGQEHDHAFLGGASERFTCGVSCAKTSPPASYEESWFLGSGIERLQVLKTTGSGFAGFMRDEFTTLPETHDRIFATSIEAEWQGHDFTADWSHARQQIRSAFIDVFANRYSNSVQETLYEMAQAAFAVCPHIYHIRITMPNRHYLLADLKPFGFTNDNEVFIPTSEPFGRITGAFLRPEQT